MCYISLSDFDKLKLEIPFEILIELIVIYIFYMVESS